MSNAPIYTIGHGNHNPEVFLKFIRKYAIQYLVDVRSVPFSRFNPQFNQDELEDFLRRHGIIYVYMGDALGGRPEDASCYTDGKVEYEIIKSKEFFRRGVQRLQVAYQKSIPLALMCSESKPEECHRSKLIGEYLEEQNIELVHIDEKGNKVSQREVMLAVTKGRGTIDLFGEKEAFTSRKAYKSA